MSSEKGIMNEKTTPRREQKVAAYESPRIVSHSAEHLKGMTIDVNACNSAFTGRRSSDSGEGAEGRSAVAY